MDGYGLDLDDVEKFLQSVTSELRGCRSTSTYVGQPGEQHGLTRG
jgi:hypothetical protein